MRTKERCRCPLCGTAHRQELEPFGAAHLPLDHKARYELLCSSCVRRTRTLVRLTIERAIALGLSNN